MKADIPIIITFNGQKGGDFGFRLASPSLLAHLKQTRSSTTPHPRPSRSSNRQRTLPNDPLPARPRRISSSAAARRFPKDFFKDDKCLLPARPKPLRRPNHPLPAHSDHSRCNFADTFSLSQPSSQSHLPAEAHC